MIRMPGVRSIGMSGVSIFSVKPKDDGELWFKGFSEGRTTVLIWKTDGTRVTIPLRVMARRPRPAPVVVTSKGRAGTADGGVSASLEVFEFPVELVDVREVGRVDGGVRFVGTDGHGASYDLVLTPKP